MEENSNKLTDINELGEFGLIKLISKNIKLKNKSSVLGIGDDSAIIDNSKLQTIVSTDMLVEGVHLSLIHI